MRKYLRKELNQISSEENKLMKRVFLIAIIGVLLCFSGCTQEDREVLGSMVAGEIKNGIMDQICGHIPVIYIESENRLTCICRTKEFPDENYDTFIKCLDYENEKWYRKIEIWLKGGKQKYYIEKYINYREVDPVFLSLAEKIDNSTSGEKHSWDEIVTKIDNAGEILDYLESPLEINRIYADIIGDTETGELIETVADFNDTLSNALEITSKAVHFARDFNGIVNSEEGEEALMAFIDVVKDCTEDLPYFSTMLDVLKPTLEKYLEGYENWKFMLDVTDLGVLDDPVFSRKQWAHFGMKAKWEEELAEVSGAEGTDFMPSLQEAIDVLDDSEALNSEEGKAAVMKYIIFRLDLIFNDAMGIGFEEYVKMLGE